MSQVSVQVIARVLTNFFHCMHCERLFDEAEIGQKVHQQELDQYPADIKQDAARLYDMLYDLINRYGDQIQFRVIDPQSPEGFFKSLRYWVRKYPTFIIDNRVKITGWDRAGLEQAFRKRLGTK